MTANQPTNADSKNTTIITEEKSTFNFTWNDVVKVDLIDCGYYYLVPSNLNPEKDNNVIKILAISDTHNKHADITNIPSADILIHAGDFTNTGTIKQIKSYNKWIGNLLKTQKKFKYAVLIAGNHDITMDEDYYHKIGYKRYHSKKKQNPQECINIIKNGNSIYLKDDLIELLGVTIYGSPYQPEFRQWAFGLSRGDALRKEWSKIPDKGIDILMTHGPPKFHGDKVIETKRSKRLNVSQWVGCHDLLQRLTELKGVQFHVFGHVHEGYGVTKNKKITDVIFINPAIVDPKYKCVNKPIMFYVKGRGRRFCNVNLNSNEEVQDAANNLNLNQIVHEKPENVDTIVQSIDKLISFLNSD
eukprot:343935_1